MDTSNWIAIVSLLFSVLAFIWSLVAQKNTKKNKKLIQKFELKAHEEKESEKKKALIDVMVCKLPDRWIVNVYNKGMATARNIRLITPDKEASSLLLPFTDMSNIPYPFLHYGGSFDLPLLVPEKHNTIEVVKVIWDDDWANNNERDIALNLLLP